MSQRQRGRSLWILAVFTAVFIFSIDGRHSLLAHFSLLSIDEFDCDQAAIKNNDESFQLCSGVLGGERDLAADGMFNTTDSFGVNSGWLRLSAIGSWSKLASAFYDGVDSSGTNANALGDVDIAQGGRQSAIWVEAEAGQNHPVRELTVQLHSQPDITAVTMNVGLPAGALNDYLVPYWDFPGAATFDFTSIDAIGLLTRTLTGGGEDDPTRFDSYRTASMLTTPMSDAITTDLNGDGLASPGDIITITTEIQNLPDLYGASVPLIDFLATVGPHLDYNDDVGTSHGAPVAGPNPQVTVGTLIDGETATITYTVTVLGGIPPATTALENDAVISFATSYFNNSDDPATPGLEDTTLTPVAPAVVGHTPNDNGAGAPLMVAKGVPGQLLLTWGATCGIGDDYAAYSGSLSVLHGSGYNHASLNCATGGFTLQTPVVAGDIYYLIVPQSPTLEGIYGHDSTGTPIPPAAAPCQPYDGVDCP